MSAKTSSQYNCTMNVSLPGIGGTPVTFKSTIPLDSVKATIAVPFKLQPGKTKSVNVLPSGISNVEFFCIRISTKDYVNDFPSAFYPFKCIFDTPQSSDSGPEWASSTSRSTNQYASNNPPTPTRGKSYKMSKAEQGSSSAYEGKDDTDKGSDTETPSSQTYQQSSGSQQSPSSSKTELLFRDDVFLIGSSLIKKLGRFNELAFASQLDDEQELTVLVGYDPEQQDDQQQQEQQQQQSPQQSGSATTTSSSSSPSQQR
jgi:hypothetical protein